MHTAESALYLGDRRRLFAGVDGRSGDSASGVRQGSTESSSAFCVGIHPEVVTLDGALRDEGGGAWGDMDDIYAVGPAAHVFPAIEAFSREVRDNLGLVLRPEKLECFSPSYDLEHCPHRAALASSSSMGRAPPVAFGADGA